MKVGLRLSLKVGQLVVLLRHKRQCVAQHLRSTHVYKHTTNPFHMPERHRRHGTWTPEHLIGPGMRTGPSTGQVVFLAPELLNILKISIVPEVNPDGLVFGLLTDMK